MCCTHAMISSFSDAQKVSTTQYREHSSRHSKNVASHQSKKVQESVPEIEFFGLRFSKDGVSPSASTVEALRNMDRPGYAAMTTSLWMLTHSDTRLTWRENEETAFRDLTQSLSADSVLGYYQVGLETSLMIDAGPTCLGLLLLQKSDDR